MVLHASYGDAPPRRPSNAGDTNRGSKHALVLDVTIPVQALVHDSQINIPKGHSKVSLLWMVFNPASPVALLASLSIETLALFSNLGWPVSWLFSSDFFRWGLHDPMEFINFARRHPI